MKRGKINLKCVSSSVPKLNKVCKNAVNIITENTIALLDFCNRHCSDLNHTLHANTTSLSLPRIMDCSLQSMQLPIAQAGHIIKCALWRACG